jgi:hypothetical protein
MASPLYSPKGKTIGLKDPYLIQKAAHAIDYSSMRIRLKACLTSSLVNINNLAN